MAHPELEYLEGLKAKGWYFSTLERDLMAIAEEALDALAEARAEIERLKKPKEPSVTTVEEALNYLDAATEEYRQALDREQP